MIASRFCVLRSRYQPPLDITWTFPPKVKNLGLRSMITRACQGFLQRVAFPLQFEFLFSFPGTINPEVFEDAIPGDYGTQKVWARRFSRTSRLSLMVDRLGC